MLQTLSQLGILKEKHESSNIKHVIGMIFTNKEGKIEYINSKLYEFDASSKYLYKRDYSGKPCYHSSLVYQLGEAIFFALFVRL